MNAKDKVLILLRRELSNANNNLFRARRSFAGMTDKELEAPYGQSGKSCQEVLDGYINQLTDLQLQLDWVRSREA